MPGVVIEIERKFHVEQDLATWPVEFLAKSAVEIHQGYLTPPETEPEVRLRKAREVTAESANFAVPRSQAEPGGVNVSYRLAIKAAKSASKDQGLSRQEIEVDLTPQQFEAAWVYTAKRRLRKVRVSYALRTVGDSILAVSIDSFRDCLSGLVLAEIEFESLQSSANFIAPDFLGIDVTHDDRYRNAELAVASHPPSPPTVPPPSATA